MAKLTLLSNPALVTSADGNPFEVQFTQSQICSNGNYGGTFTAYIEVLSGSWQFNVGANPVATSAVYAVAGEKLPITFVPGAKNIFADSVAGSATFRISV